METNRPDREVRPAHEHDGDPADLEWIALVLAGWECPISVLEDRPSGFTAASVTRDELLAFLRPDTAEGLSDLFDGQV